MYNDFVCKYVCTLKICTIAKFPTPNQSYIYQVLQTIQMKCVWAEPAILGSAKTALKFIYKI